MLPISEVKGWSPCYWWHSVSMGGKWFQSHPEDDGDTFFFFFFPEILNLSLSFFCTWSQVDYSHLTRIHVHGFGHVYDSMWENESSQTRLPDHPTGNILVWMQFNVFHAVVLWGLGIGDNFRETCLLSNLIFDFPIASKSTAALTASYFSHELCEHLPSLI